MTKVLVGGEGPDKPRIAIVGEAAGSTEIFQRKPFVGPAGRELNRFLRLANIARTDCYLTNTIKEEAVGSKLQNFIKFPKDYRGSVVTGPLYNDYREYLLGELNELDTNVIVPMGRTALYALYGKYDIAKRRGSLLYSDELPGKTIIPTYHPASVLYHDENTGAFLNSYFIIHDLARAAMVAETGVRPPERNLVIEPSFLTTIEWLERAIETPLTGFDIEVLKETLVCFAIALDPFNAICIPFTDAYGNNYFSADQEYEVWTRLRTYLEKPSITKVYQNVMFDGSWMLNNHGIVCRGIDDTMILQALANNDFPKGLDTICSLYTLEPYYKDEGKKYMKAPTDIHTFWRYNAKDAAVTLEARTPLTRDVNQIGNLRAYTTHIAVVDSLLYMQYRGMRLDIPGLTAYTAKVKDEITELSNKIRITCGDLNPNSPAQVKDYFYRHLGVKAITTRDGKETSDEKAMKKLAGKGFEEARWILRLRELKKFVSSYGEIKLDTDNRLRGSANPVGTKTGRLSSTKTIRGTGGNTQNLPQDFKQFIMADENCFLILRDGEQAENRIVAHIAPEPVMMRAFRDGSDIHSLTGAMLSGLDYDTVKRLAVLSEDFVRNQVLDEYTENPFAPVGAGDKPWRYWGKMCNHALNYGLGAIKFAAKLEIDVATAKRFRSRYYQVYPGVLNYHAWVEEELRRNRFTLTNPMGRKRRFYDTREYNGVLECANEAYAQLPQSTVAYKINEHGILFMEHNQDIYRRWELLNQEHDALFMQVHGYDDPREIAHGLMLQSRAFESPISFRGVEFSIPFDTKIGLSRGRMVKLKVDKYDLDKTTQNLTEAIDIIRSN